MNDGNTEQQLSLALSNGITIVGMNVANARGKLDAADRGLVDLRRVAERDLTEARSEAATLRIQLENAVADRDAHRHLSEKNEARLSSAESEVARLTELVGELETIIKDLIAASSLSDRPSEETMRRVAERDAALGENP